MPERRHRANARVNTARVSVHLKLALAPRESSVDVCSTAFAEHTLA
jgi:hypothetical protein